MKSIITLVFALFLTINYAEAKARIPVCIPCEKISKVQDIPTSENVKDEFGKDLHLGYFYKEYGIVFVPAWISDGRYVLTNEAQDTYYDLTDEDKTYLQEQLKVELSKNPLSFWKKIGGKLVYLVLIGLLVWGNIPSKEND